MQRPAIPRWRLTVTPVALAIVSLIAALILWIIVTEAETPRRQLEFGASIEVKPVNVPDGLAVARITPPAVRIRISTDDETLERLSTADFRVEVDLGGLRDGSAELVVVARVTSNLEVDIVEVQQSLVTVELEPSATKQVPVVANVVGEVASGFRLSSIDPDPGVVRVTGAVSLVGSITSAVAEINLDELQASVDQQVFLTVRDSRGVDIRGVLIEPIMIDIKVTISQQEVTLPLSVIPDVQGDVADGFNIIGISVSPSVVSVQGAVEAIRGLTTLMTEPINVDNLTADITMTVELRLPSGIKVDPESVTVVLSIAATQGEIALTVAPRVTGLGEGLTANLQTSSLLLILSGDLPTLKELNASLVSATVTVLDLEPGVHVLTPTILTPPGVEVVSSDPDQVVIVISE